MDGRIDKRDPCDPLPSEEQDSQIHSPMSNLVANYPSLL